jgi:hypothetical protein
MAMRRELRMTEAGKMTKMMVMQNTWRPQFLTVISATWSNIECVYFGYVGNLACY